MDHRTFIVSAVIIGLFAVSPSDAASSRQDLLKEIAGYKAYFAPLSAKIDSKTNPGTPDKITLGKLLYFEKRLSKSQSISCNSCHLLDRFGVDNQPQSPGHRKKLGTRNSPTVYNAAFNFKQFWDGRAADLEEQAIGPVLNPVEMAMPSEDYVLDVLRSIPEYEAAFKRAFPQDKNPVTYKNVGRAIAAYERTLLTPSRFDRFLAGDDTALSLEELQGLKTFVDTGCTTCHSGVGIGGHHFQKIGQVKEYKTKDQGRFEVTKDPNDRFYFKVPSLRNVAKTAPYFHDGSKKTLAETVQTMAEYQLGEALSREELEAILAFLGALTGDVPQAAITPPELPPSGPTTPKPDLN